MQRSLFRSLLTAFLVCFTVITIAGCGHSDPVDGKVYHQDGGMVTIDFKDGKAKVEMMGDSKTLDYKVDGDKITIINSAEGNLELTHHSDGTLTGAMGTLRTAS